ncbi:MAG: hypothetical protein UT84_C0010G0006 [Candidatus Curtissbacteria bacterium GW2011_GWA1_40_16]|uniref:DUF5673 domain-containing protein n=1 Tax=Candidatus Curtissbacteria bacterium GW2011_GWA1_40_16 TaxID=1618405 RepID=A0A0G0RDW7_9BACT|nr:MAG: hypothetical protein UT84_C0010G0006 [Candidatus Curtissbacteria bacterium GW2011_GWA1_40_16]
MAKFKRNEQVPQNENERVLSKEELDTKHQAALEANNIISWKSPVRVFKARSRQYFVKVGLYGLVFILAAIAFGEFLLVGVILAVIFLVYVLASIAPETIEHRITNMGVVSGGKAFLWDDLDSFWFEKKGEDRLLVVQTRLHFPSRLIIILTTVSERGLLDILEKHLHYHHGPVHTLFDKWALFLQERVNLE